MILVTGGAGFIGSVLVWKLNDLGRDDVIVSDHFGHGLKWRNLAKRRLNHILTKEDLPAWLGPNRRKISAILHMGACSSTTETDSDYLVRNNFQYSVNLFEFCARESIPFIYASSAATYGDGERGYVDAPDSPNFLKPVNAYGFSKNVFDQWAIRQKHTPPFWAGLKFFNVYGPQEYHKGNGASVIFHAYGQIATQGQLKLFKSYRPEIPHGEQKRDFVYVKDVANVIIHLWNERTQIPSGIYNVGTGLARSFTDLGRGVFRAMGHASEKFVWIDMPEEMRPRYQYYTAADLTKLREEAGYQQPFTSLEAGIDDYVKSALATPDPYLS